MVALSGGVDSAVSAALLLRAGYEVEAAFMKNWSKTEGLIKNDCPWLEDRRDALRVAAFLDIPLKTFDFEKEYSEKVMEYFFKEYSEGRTPNPDVMCNKEIKFKLLYNAAMNAGFDYLATGHYAQVIGDKLVRSKDEFKDQTYFIYNLQKEQLGHILFPIGKYKKSEVRSLAKKFKLPNAERRESMGLCFVGKVKLEDFLQQNIKTKPGEIVDTSGKKVGTHNGVWNYTLGQRQGLKVGGDGPFYVVGKDIKKNQLIVSKDQDDAQLMLSTIFVSAVNWVDVPKQYPFKCLARFRHQQELQDVEVVQIDPKSYNIEFKIPQRAITSGQSVVFYKGKECLGGGVIQ
jgi:tRNA-specific 2-thiouridylase